MITPRSSSLATSTGPGPTSSLTPQQLASWNDSSHKNEVAGIGLLVVVSIALSFCFFYVTVWFLAHHISNPENIFRRTCYWLPGIPRPPSKPHPCHVHNHKFEYHTKSQSGPKSPHTTRVNTRQPPNAITVELSRPSLHAPSSKNDRPAFRETFGTLGLSEGNDPPSPAYAPPSPAYQASLAPQMSQVDLATVRIASAQTTSRPLTSTAVPSIHQSTNALTLPGLSRPGTVDALPHHSLNVQPQDRVQTSLNSASRNGSRKV